jgi:phenylalanyl-tRNA synthetase beta chain
MSRSLRAAFRGAGLTELIHYSLVKPGEKNQVELANPLFAEYSSLRTQMLSGLINAFQENQDQGNGALNGFEIGQIFWKEGEALKEKEAIAGILGGDPTVGRWVRSGKEQPMTWYEAKGLLDSIFERVGVAVEYRPWGNETVKNNVETRSVASLQASALSPDFASATLHPGRTASLWLWGKCLGVFGQLHPQLRQQRELIDEVYVFQLDLGLLVQAASKNTTQKFAAYSTFPASDRDLAFFSPVDLSVADLQKVMVKAGGKLLESVELFDQYQGKNVPDGQRSLAFRLVYRVGDRTLTEQDIEPIHNKVRDALMKQFNLTLRS